jgi:hypothetical protein
MTLIRPEAPNCTIDTVVNAGGTVLNFLVSNSAATGLKVNNCQTGNANSETIYIGGTANASITNNKIGDSYGETSLRTDEEVDGAVVHLPTGLTISGNTIGTGGSNMYGKQVCELREGSGIVGANHFNGPVRVGQNGATPALVFTFSGNTYADAIGLPPGTPTNALAILGGVTATVTNETFASTACGYPTGYPSAPISPIAVARNSPANHVTITKCTSTGPKPLVATSSDAGAFTAAGNTLLPAPK